MIGDIMQPTHLLFVLAIALLVLGPKRLPEVGRQLGNGIRDFRAAISGEHQEHQDEIPGAYAAGQQPQQTAPDEHHFAHAAPEPVQGEHQFAHASSEVASDGNQLTGSDSDSPAGHQTVSDASPSANEHEFAYEPSPPADKPVDPLG